MKTKSHNLNIPNANKKNLHQELILLFFYSAIYCKMKINNIVKS